MELTFQILEGFEKGRLFRALSSPVSIGREDENSLRLNDDRVSRFHAKISVETGEVILVDLDSTNGTRVNGQPINLRCLLPGDRIQIGKTAILFGSSADIQKSLEDIQSEQASPRQPAEIDAKSGKATGTSGNTTLGRYVAPWGGETAPIDGPWKYPEPGNVHSDKGLVFFGKSALPPLPAHMSPTQVARLSELLDFLHWNLCLATEKMQGNQIESGQSSTIDFASTQRILAVQIALARYALALADPVVNDEINASIERS